jgi:hypothetical protein
LWPRLKPDTAMPKANARVVLPALFAAGQLHAARDSTLTLQGSAGVVLRAQLAMVDT